MGRCRGPARNDRTGLRHDEANDRTQLMTRALTAIGSPAFASGSDAGSGGPLEAAVDFALRVDVPHKRPSSATRLGQRRLIDKFAEVHRT